MPQLVRPALPKTLQEAHAQLDEFWDVLCELKGKVDDLSEQLSTKGKHSGNSSKPPSTDSDAQKAARRNRRGKDKSPRKRGDLRYMHKAPPLVKYALSEARYLFVKHFEL